MNQPSLLALDFDGVLCNGLREYFQTSKQAYRQIWPVKEDLDEYTESFYRLRPVVEHGWEMPLIIRALVLGKSEQEILDNWMAIVETLLKQENIVPSLIMQELDRTRDRQINNELSMWLSLQEFYPGVIKKMQHIQEQGLPIYIISTKEGRFIGKLLEIAEISLPDGHIIGKEIKQSKAQSLLDLVNSKGISPKEIWFVEDRLETLKSILKEKRLQGIGLFLARWGYNLDKSKEDAQKDPSINLLSLEQFQAPFKEWPSKDVGFSQTSD